MGSHDQALIRQRRREEYLRNREAYLARAKKRRVANPERHNADNRRWAASHPDKVKASRKRRADKQSAAWQRWYAIHRDEFLAYCRDRYARDPERIKANVRAWVAANKDTDRYKLQRAASSQRRRAALIAAGPTIRAADLLIVAERDKGKCYLCGRKVDRRDWSFDHVIPLAKGGTNDPANLALTHRKCNSSKGAKLVRLC